MNWLNPYMWGGVAVALFLAFIYGVHIESVRFAEFRAQVEVVGKAQEKRTLERTAFYKKVTKESDNEYKKRFVNLNGRIDSLTKRLRTQPGGSVLPPVATNAPSPERACFDRPQLDRALRDFTAETAGLVGEGDKVRLKLDTAIQWNRDIRHGN